MNTTDQIRSTVYLIDPLGAAARLVGCWDGADVTPVVTRIGGY